jgi:hypothetical protein
MSSVRGIEYRHAEEFATYHAAGIAAVLSRE